MACISMRRIARRGMLLVSGLTAVLLAVSDASGQIVTETERETFSMTDRPIDFGLPTIDPQRVFFGVDFGQGGELFARAFGDPTGDFLFDEEVVFRLTADPNTRMGVEFFAGVEGGTLSSTFLSDFRGTFQKTVQPGQPTFLLLDDDASNTSTNALLQAKSPTISAGGDFVLEGGFNASVAIEDILGNPVLDAAGQPMAVELPVALPGTSPIFEVKPGETSVDLASIGPSDLSLQVPPSVTTLGDTTTFVELPAPQGFRISGQGAQEPFMSLAVDTDEILVELLARRDLSAGIPGVATIGVEGAGFVAEVDTTDFFEGTFLEPVALKADASFDLIDLPLNFGAAIKHKYELTVDSFDVSNFRVVNAEGDVVVNETITANPTNFEWRVPEGAEAGDVLTVLLDVDINGSILTITELFSPVSDGLTLLDGEITLTVGGQPFTVFDAALGSVTEDRLSLNPVEIGRAETDVSGFWDTQTLAFDVIVVPEPSTAIAFAALAAALITRPRSRRIRHPEPENVSGT